MASFELLFPSLIAKAADLHALLRVAAFGLFIVGTILAMWPRPTPSRVLRHLVRLLVLTSLLVFLPEWGNQFQSLLQSSILSGLGVEPENLYKRYQELLIIKDHAGPEHSWWEILTSGVSVELLITGALYLLGQFAGYLLFWAYILQKVLLYIGYALSPVLIGFMAIPALRSLGSRYLLGLVGVLLWPLGWAVAALITQGLLDFMTDPSTKVIDPSALIFRVQTVFGLGVLAFWVAASTVVAPLVIQKVFTQGALAGGEMINSVLGSFLQTAATTAGAAAGGSSTGIPLVTAASAGMAGALSTFSTAAGLGSAGAIIIAGSGLPPRSARGRPGDDITGDRAVRDLIARSKNHYY